MTALLAERLQKLTDREVEVYHLIRSGYPTAKIGDKLNIAWSTAKLYRKRINRKLGLDWRNNL